MSPKIFLLVLVITATAYSQPARDFDFAEFRRCARLSVERTCTDHLDSVTKRLETLVNCGKSEVAGFAANYCANDEEAGLYCGAAVAYSLEFGNAQFGPCGAAIQSPGDSCPDECKNSLLAIRNDLGCCVNAFYNNTATYAIFSPVLSYSLWSRCNVEPPNSTCDGALPYTLPATPLQTCTLDEILSCTKTDIEGIRNSINGEPSCEVFLQYNIDVCSRMDASDDGSCIVGIESDLAASIPSLTSSCGTARSTQSCSESCRESLEEFIERRGCCVNTLYNSTYGQATGLNTSTPFFQDNVVLDLCGVEAPPLTCSTDGSLPLKSFTVMMLLPLILMALLGNKI